MPCPAHRQQCTQAGSLAVCRTKCRSMDVHENERFQSMHVLTCTSNPPREGQTGHATGHEPPLLPGFRYGAPHHGAAITRPAQLAVLLYTCFNCAMRRPQTAWNTLLHGVILLCAVRSVLKHLQPGHEHGLSGSQPAADQRKQSDLARRSLGTEKTR